MGRILSSFILLGSLLGFCLLGMLYSNHSTTEMNAFLEQAISAAEEDDWEQAKILSEKSMDMWERHYKKLSLYTPHSKLDSISQNLSVLTKLAHYKAKEQFTTECCRCRNQITGLQNTEIPTIENIL